MRVAVFAGLLMSFLASFASAENYSEGKDYVQLPEQVRPADPSKIEVAEVFSYACPHCFHFEPLLSAWAKKQPADVLLVQTHASFGRPDWTSYQRGYYTAIALKIKDKVQDPIFNNIHVAHKELSSPQDWADFFANYGVDKETTLKTFNSFWVNSQINQAEARTRNFKVNSTPTLVVDGKYRITATKHEDMLAIAQFLVDKARAERSTIKK